MRVISMTGRARCFIIPRITPVSDVTPAATDETTTKGLASRGVQFARDALDGELSRSRGRRNFDGCILTRSVFRARSREELASAMNISAEGR